MNTTNVSTLKIHKLTQAQYNRELANGNIDETALYLTPDEGIDLSGYATTEQLNGKSDISHTHNDLYYTETEIDTKLESKAHATHAHTVSQISDLAVTATELNYMDGVTSNVQAQLDGKADANHTHSASSGLRCYTTSDMMTTTKIVNLYSGSTLTLEAGMIFMVDFMESSMMPNVSLNINGTGAYPIMVDGSTCTVADTKYTGMAMATITYMFNGTHYVWLNTDYGAASANRIMGGTFTGNVSAYRNSSSDGAPTTYMLRNSVITTEVQDVAGLLYQPMNGEIKWYYK